MTVWNFLFTNVWSFKSTLKSLTTIQGCFYSSFVKAHWKHYVRILQASSAQRSPSLLSSPSFIALGKVQFGTGIDGTLFSLSKILNFVMRSKKKYFLQFTIMRPLAILAKTNSNTFSTFKVHSITVSGAPWNLILQATHNASFQFLNRLWEEILSLNQRHSFFQIRT